MRAPVSKARLVFEAIAARIRDGELANRTQLPAVGGLAAEFRVSRSTIQQALGLLAEAGLVDRRRGSGVYVRGGIEPPRDLEAHPTAVARAAAALAADIRAGEFPVGEVLPMRKALQYRYHACPAVLRAALRLVEARRLIHRRGSNYLVGVGASPVVGAACRVVSVIGSTAQFERMLNWRISREFLRSLERELNRHGVTQFRMLDPVREPSRALRVLSRRETVGFLGLGLCDGMPRPPAARLAALYESAARTGLPVVHFNWNNTRYVYPRMALTTRENVFLLVVDNAAGGENLGAYLAGLGHRHVAFFAYAGDTAWCRERHQGLVRGLARTAAPGARVFCFRNPAGVASIPPARLAAATAAVRKLFGRHSLRSIDPVQEVLHRAREFLYLANFRRAMAPSFRQALTRPDITAWVCAAEMEAVGASEFLQGEGVKVPGDLSLAGINNDQDAAAYGLTMYDFQKDRMGYLAAHAFLGDLPLKRRRDGVLETPGRVVVRRSTGRASVQR